jgi:Flp pilus assembly protein TadB
MTDSQINMADDKSLEIKLDDKRQEVNQLQIKYKVLEAQIAERQARLQKDSSLLQTLLKLSSPENEKEKEERITDLAKAMEELRNEQDVLSKERIEIVRIAQELENARGDLMFLMNRKNKINNTTAWMSGSFYVFSAILIMTLLAVISSLLPWYSVGVIFAGGLISVIVIGVLQLRNDKNLSEESFKKIIIEAIKNIPKFLKSGFSK